MDATTSIPAIPAFVARALRAGTTVTPAGRWTSVAGAAYVAGWVLGLALVPSVPADVHSFYVAHPALVAVQALLVHGVAGVALGILALVLPRAVGLAGRSAALVRTAGLAAAAVSLAQTALTLVALAQVGSSGPAATVG